MCICYVSSTISILCVVGALSPVPLSLSIGIIFGIVLADREDVVIVSTRMASVLSSVIMTPVSIVFSTGMSSGGVLPLVS